MKKEEFEFRRSVARKLAVARMFENISQSELADRVGTNKSNISRMESGNQNITLDYVESIANALGKDIRLVLKEPSLDYGDETEYSLRLFDEELMRFKLTRDYGLSCEITYINEERIYMLPLEMDVDEDGVIKWLRHRTIPKNRELVGHILTALNLDINNLKGIIDVCMGLSLNDSYWVVPKDFEGKFGEYNLYLNEFDEALSLVAYTGNQFVSNEFKTSPELTTGGMLRKAWRRNDKGEIWLYKSGTDGFANAGLEPYSEYYACQVAEQMGLNVVHYELESWKHILASKCKLFTDVKKSYIPIGRIVRTGGIEAVIEYYKSLGDDFYQELASMLVFDAVIINEDRHYGNFGVIRDMVNGKIISPAPIFDNGTSLLCYAMKSDFKELDEYINSRTNPYGRDNSYLELAKRVMGKKQKEQLRRLINFRFKESDVCNLPSWRLHALENLIQDRVQQLLII